MLRLDVVAIGVVAFAMPQRIQHADAEDLDRALRLLAEGGCRATIVDIDAVSYVSGDALRVLVDCMARTRGTDMRLVFVADGNLFARRLLRDLTGGLCTVHRSMAEATASLTAVRAR